MSVLSRCIVSALYRQHATPFDAMLWWCDESCKNFCVDLAAEIAAFVDAAARNEIIDNIRSL